jgi:plasmid maintenance system antidote protein VapI
MHKSLGLLHEMVRRRIGRTLSPAQLAKALNVSEQVVTNWSKRGISMDGALKAQLVFGVDANFLLGLIPHPMLVPNQPAAKQVALVTADVEGAYSHNEHWPFHDVSPDDWKHIPEQVRDAFEKTMLAIAKTS